MRSRNLWLSATTIALFVLSGWLVTPSIRAADAPAAGAADAPKPVESQTWTGRIVEVHHYLVPMLEGKPSKASEGFKPGEGQPIALVPVETSVIQKAVPGKTSFVIMFDSKDEASMTAYKEARKMYEHPVKLTGKLYDRDGLSAVTIEKIEAAATEAAAAN